MPDQHARKPAAPPIRRPSGQAGIAVLHGHGRTGEQQGERRHHGRHRGCWLHPARGRTPPCGPRTSRQTSSRAVPCVVAPPAVGLAGAAGGRRARRCGLDLVVAAQPGTGQRQQRRDRPACRRRPHHSRRHPVSDSHGVPVFSSASSRPTTSAATSELLVLAAACAAPHVRQVAAIRFRRAAAKATCRRKCHQRRPRRTPGSARPPPPASPGTERRAAPGRRAARNTGRYRRCSAALSSGIRRAAPHRIVVQRQFQPKRASALIVVQRSGW